MRLRNKRLCGSWSWTGAASLALALVFLHATPAEAERPLEANISYVDAQPLTLSVNEDDRTASASVAVRNTGGAPGRVKFCALVQGKGRVECNHQVTVLVADKLVRSDQIVLLPIRIEDVQPPVAGYLGLQTYDESGKALNTSLRQLKIDPPTFPRSAWYLVVLGSISALCVCLVVGLRLKRQRLSLFGRMGTPTWDFTRSWASNITIAGALLSAALYIAVFPEQTRYISKGGFGVLTLLFTLLAGFAPFVFNVFRRGGLDPTAPPGAQLHYQGFVIWFLAASGITIGAVSAQMLTLAVVIAEISSAGRISPLVSDTLLGLVACLEAGILVYAAATMYWTAKSQIVHRTQAIESLAAQQNVAPASLADAHVPLPQWTPL
jgi:hypothetical protein